MYFMSANGSELISQGVKAFFNLLFYIKKKKKKKKMLDVKKPIFYIN